MDRRSRFGRLVSSLVLLGSLFLQASEVCSQQCDVWVYKRSSAWGIVWVGETLSFWIEYGNHEPFQNAENVVVEDLLPTGLRYVSSDPPATFDPGLRKLTWNLGTLGPGSWGSLTVDTEIEESAGRHLVNEVRIATTSSDADLSNNAASLELLVGHFGECDAWVEKRSDPPDEVSPGEGLIFYIPYGNGPIPAFLGGGLFQENGHPAENARVVDFLPRGLRYVRSFPSGEYDPEAHAVTWDLGTIPWYQGGELMIETAVESPAGTELLNVASISTSNPDVDPRNNVVHYRIAVVDPFLNVFIAKWAQTTVMPGRAYTCVLQVGNSGPLPAPDVVVRDVLPPAVTFVSASRGTYLPGEHAVVLSLGTIEGRTSWNEWIQVFVPSTVPLGTELVNSAEISTTGDDRRPEDNASQCTTIVSAAQDPNEKLLAQGPKVPPGSILEYTIHYENIGTEAAYGVYVTDALPASLDLDTLEILDGGTMDWGVKTITWYVGTVEAKQGGSVRFSAKALADLPEGASIANWATVYFPSVPEETRTNVVVTTIGICPEEGDTHCVGLEVEGPPGGVPGTWVAIASAKDDSGDDVVYVFEARRGEEAPIVVGPQKEKWAEFELSEGSWTIAVSADDDPLCDDEAADARCSVEVLVAPAGGRIVPGDCNRDAKLDISDAVSTLGVLFLGSPPRFPCGDGDPSDPANVSLLDWQPDGKVDISDAIGILSFLFTGGPPHPQAVPGSETTGCVRISGCPDLPGCGGP